MNLISYWHRHFYFYTYNACWLLSPVKEIQVIPLFYKICFSLKISPDWQNIKHSQLFPLWEVRSLSCPLPEDRTVQHQPACLRPGRGSGTIRLNQWGKTILAIIIERVHMLLEDSIVHILTIIIILYFSTIKEGMNNMTTRYSIIIPLSRLAYGVLAALAVKEFLPCLDNAEP